LLQIATKNRRFFSLRGLAGKKKGYTGYRVAKVGGWKGSGWTRPERRRRRNRLVTFKERSREMMFRAAATPPPFVFFPTFD
jgi:hypothetical protein